MQEIELISCKCVCREADWQGITLCQLAKNAFCVFTEPVPSIEKKMLLSVAFFQLDSIVARLFICFLVTEILWLMCMVGHFVEENGSGPYR